MFSHVFKDDYFSYFQYLPVAVEYVDEQSALPAVPEKTKTKFNGYKEKKINI